MSDNVTNISDAVKQGSNDMGLNAQQEAQFKAEDAQRVRKELVERAIADLDNIKEPFLVENIETGNDEIAAMNNEMLEVIRHIIDAEDEAAAIEVIMNTQADLSDAIDDSTLLEILAGGGSQAIHSLIPVFNPNQVVKLFNALYQHIENTLDEEEAKWKADDKNEGEFPRGIDHVWTRGVFSMLGMRIEHSALTTFTVITLLGEMLENNYVIDGLICMLRWTGLNAANRRVIWDMLLETDKLDFHTLVWMRLTTQNSIPEKVLQHITEYDKRESIDQYVAYVMGNLVIGDTLATQHLEQDIALINNAYLSESIVDAIRDRGEKLEAAAELEASKGLESANDED